MHKTSWAPSHLLSGNLTIVLASLTFSESRALSIDPQHPCEKSRACSYVPVTLAMEVDGMEAGESFWTSWLPTWLKNISRLCEKACLREVRWCVRNDTHGWPLTPTHTCSYLLGPSEAYISHDPQRAARWECVLTPVLQNRKQDSKGNTVLSKVSC